MPSKEISIFLHDQVEPTHGIVTIGNYKVGYFISRSKLKTSEENEDCLFLKETKDEILLGVCDGAGGHPRGRDASYTIGNTFMKESGPSKHELINKINKEVIDLKVGAKSTLAFASFKGDFVKFFSVGDSEVLYWNYQGNEVYSSTPHSIVGHRVKAGDISQSESLHDSERHYVNNMMGDEFVKIESTTNIQIKKGHTILIGSDGIFDNLSHSELHLLAASGSFESSFEGLVKVCTEQDEEKWIKDDDIAFILVRKIIA
tara:strand:+ start:129 stop:905 length:777 start_codon:yes stop_codon:yes gene_type:complete